MKKDIVTFTPVHDNVEFVKKILGLPSTSKHAPTWKKDEIYVQKSAERKDLADGTVEFIMKCVPVNENDLKPDYIYVGARDIKEHVSSGLEWGKGENQPSSCDLSKDEDLKSLTDELIEIMKYVNSEEFIMGLETAIRCYMDAHRKPDFATVIFKSESTTRLFCQTIVDRVTREGFITTRAIYDLAVAMGGYIDIFPLDYEAGKKIGWTKPEDCFKHTGKREVSFYKPVVLS